MDCELLFSRLEDLSAELFSDLVSEFEALLDDDSVSAAVLSEDLLMTVHGPERVLTVRRALVSEFPDASGDSIRVAARSVSVRSFIRY